MVKIIAKTPMNRPKMKTKSGPGKQRPPRTFGVGRRLSRMKFVPLHERVLEELRDAITGGRLQPGESLTLRGLAAEIGTSIMPIRDAVKQLVSAGALEAAANRTVRVPPLTADRFKDVTAVRQIVEARAAQLAATRISDDETDALRKINEDMEIAERENDLRATFRLNREFHFRLYRASGNDLLVSIIEKLWLLAGPYMSLSWNADPPDRRRDSAHAVYVHHGALLRALEQRSAQAAGRHIEHDIKATAGAILKMDVFARPSDRKNSPR
jgi:DNA-binding GntR family transcriptional regulator